jgi:hypothetical protein
VGRIFLDNQYNRVQQEVNDIMKTLEGVTFFIDDSLDSCQDPITHVVAASANEAPFFLKKVLHLDEAHTSDRMLEIANTCIEELNSIGVET